MVYIYILIDPRTNEIRYLGKTNNPKRRKSEHLSEYNKSRNTPQKMTHKDKWIKQLKKVGLKPIMEIFDTVPQEEEDFWECHYISLLKSWGIELTNLTDGGDNPPIRFGNDNVFIKNKDVREKILAMNKSRKGKTLVELYGEEKAKELIEQRSKRMSGKNNPNAGKKVTQETRDKISKGNKGKCLGIKRSDEFIRNLSKRMSERVVSESTKQKHREIALNRPPASKETRDKLSLKLKGRSYKGKIYQLDKETKVIIREWKGVAELKDEYGSKSCNICSCVNGKLKSAYGYFWTREKPL